MRRKNDLSRRTLFAIAASIAATSLPAHALVINATYDSTVTALPYAASVESAFNYVIEQYEGLYANNETLNIVVGTTTDGLGHSYPAYYNTTFATIRSKLSALSASPDQVTSASYLPTSDPTGSGPWQMTWMNAKTLGLVTANDTHNDGGFSFNRTASYTFDPFDRAVTNENDFIGAAEHEVSELMGRTFESGDYMPNDLFRYNGPGDIVPEHNINGTYFSIDGGNTNLRTFNAGPSGDPQDWDSSVVDSYDAFLTLGTNEPVTSVDQTAMHVLGYNPTSFFLNWKGGYADFFTDHNWSTSTQSGINPHNGAILTMDVSGGFAQHTFTAGENVTFSNDSDLGQQLEVSNGVVQFGVADTASTNGYGLILDQYGALQMDTNGVMYIAGPLILGNAFGVTYSHAELFGSSSLNIGTVSGTTRALEVGNNGVGTVNQYGNAVVNVPTLDLGVNLGGNGTYSLSGSATLTVSANEIIGDQGTGSLTQSGGAQTVNGSLIIGNGPFSSGSLTVSGGSMQVGGNAMIGGNSSGWEADVAVTVNGGSLNIGGNLKLYQGSTINLSSGTLAAGSINFASTSIFNWTGGTFRITNSVVDFPGTGTDPNNSHPLGTTYYFNQGTLQVDLSEWICGDNGFLSVGSLAVNSSTNIYVGSPAVSTPAQYYLYGSAISTNEDVGYVDHVSGGGGTGNFNQYSGTNTVTNLNIGQTGTGTYTLSGGTLTAGTISLASLGTFHQAAGTLAFTNFNQSGGTATFDTGLALTDELYTLSGGTANFTAAGTTLTISTVAGTSFTLNGGTLNANSIGNSGGHFTWSSGTLNILTSIDFTNITDPSNRAAFGNTLVLGSGDTLSATASEWVYGAGAHVTESGGNNSTATLEIGSYDSNGTASVYTLSSGTLTTTATYVGYVPSGGLGAATFTQTGGTQNTKTLVMGYSGGEGGTYSLSGSGALNATSDLVVGDGTGGSFTQSGGTVTTRQFILETTGTATVSLGSFTAAETINEASFRQTGGTVALGRVTNTGSLTIGNASGAAATLTVTGLQQHSVSILSTGLVQLTGGTGNAINSLSITGAGKFDLTNTHLIINYGGGSDPISSIVALIVRGYAGGAWTGSGIFSSTAQSNSGSYGIGYADWADPNNPAGLSSGQIEIAYTLLGDANLDDKVNGTDFTLMATNFNQAVTNGWDEGDFNYSGAVNGSDFLLLADNFNQFASQSDVSAADLDALDTFAAANGISLASVPEPSMGVLVGAALVGARRRRPAGKSLI